MHTGIINDLSHIEGLRRLSFIFFDNIYVIHTLITMTYAQRRVILIVSYNFRGNYAYYRQVLFLYHREMAVVIYYFSLIKLDHCSLSVRIDWLRGFGEKREKNDGKAIKKIGEKRRLYLPAVSNKHINHNSGIGASHWFSRFSNSTKLLQVFGVLFTIWPVTGQDGSIFYWC